MSSRERVRSARAVANLALWFAILCCLAALSIVALQQGRAAGWGLGGALPSAEAPAMQIPALGVTIEVEDLLPEEQTAALERLAAAGIGWVRQRVDWANLEPLPGEFDWRALDGLVDRITAAGLEPVLVLDNSPEWARAPADRGLPLAPPLDPSDLAGFAGSLADRYGDRIRFYQIWDEPNISPHWGTEHIDPVAYAQLLRSAAKSIRAADPDAVIVGAALAPTDDRGHLAIDESWFLLRMVAAGAAGSVDAIAAEPFGFGYSPVYPGPSSERLDFQRVTHVRRALLAAGLGELPVWVARFGWNRRTDSPWGTVTAGAQREYTAQARGIAQQWPWLATLGWVIDKPSAAQDSPAWGFSLDDALLAALTGEPAAVPSPDRRAPGLALALWTSIALVATVLVWPALRQLPVASLREAYGRAPAWIPVALWAGLLVVYYLATWPPLIALCWLGGAMLAALSPTNGIVVALASLPFIFQHKEIALGDWTLPVAPSLAAVLILAPVTVARSFASLRAQPRPWKAWGWSEGLVLAWIGLSLLSAAGVWYWRGYLAGMINLVLAPAMLYLAIRLFTDGGASGRSALIALFAGGLFAAVIGLVRWIGGDGVDIDGVRRLVGPHFSPNHTALYLVRTLYVGLGLAFAVHGRRRALWLCAVAVVAAALTLTASRGALILGVPAGVLTCAWLWWHKDSQPIGGRIARLLRRRPVQIAIVAAPICVLAVVAAGEARLFNEESIDSRLVLWRASLALFRDFPWTGVGPNGFFWRYPAYLPLGILLEPSLEHPHNIWLELGIGWGFFGILWVAALAVWWFLSATLRIHRIPYALQWPAVGLTAAAMAAIAHAQVDAFLALPDLAMWLFAALAIYTVLMKSGSGRLQASP